MKVENADDRFKKRSLFIMEPIPVPRKRTEVLVNDFVRSVYNWMFIGLTLTGFMAYFVSTNEAILHLIYSNRLVFFGLIIAELVLVFSIAGMVNRMSASTATVLFVIYSVLNGVTPSFIFLAYARASIVSTFFICSAT
jgi:FtsH-binding integral membrane protein